jgi:ubiquinone/menaquinone biosynthesis C-methylase UbiE
LKNQFKKKKIIRDYNSSAPFYDKRYKKIQEEKYNIVLNGQIISMKRILDLGCGTGLLFEYFLRSEAPEKFIGSKYIAIDISLMMLEEFKLKLLNLKKKAFISLILSDIEHLPFREDSFNLILSFTSFQNLPTYNKSIQEIFRVSSKGTKIIISILKKKLLISEFISKLNPYLIDIDVVDIKELEDVIIKGKISNELNSKEFTSENCL